MSIKSRFLISGILMLVIPILAISLMTVIFLALFFLSVPVHTEYLKPGADILSILDDPDFQQLLVFWSVFSVLIVVFNSIIITLYLSKALLRPLRDLKNAANNIKNGNLDAAVLTSKYSELNELCLAFDAMRMRLKENSLARLEYENERNMLIANISHDLRTPVTSVKGYVEGILDGVADTPEKVRRYLETVLQKAETLEALVESMSEFSAYEMNMVGYNFEYIDIVPFLSVFAEEHRLDLESAGIELKFSGIQTECVVMADKLKLRRVFDNLIVNAVKYRRTDSPFVDISIDVGDSGVVVTIADNGTGISREDIHKVFEGHFRGDRSRNSEIKGHGLGLSISKQIISAHRGKIWLKSEEHEGTSVFVFLPKASPDTVH